MARMCKYCNSELIRRSDENRFHFENRQFCGRTCANRHNQNILKYNTELKWKPVIENKLIDKWLMGKL